jgi:16S rRNA (guanine966-N2)-methyltransferase
LKSVPGDTTRPITDRVKENLFNIVGMDVLHSSWLDLFAGTGSVGIEALSRGAEIAVFLDKERQAVNTIKSNLQTTRLSDNARIVLVDAFEYLKSQSIQQFDYIFIAPPQYHDMWQKSLSILDARPEWLSEDGWIVVQIDPVEYCEIQLKNFSEFDQRRYGSTVLVFYRS